MDLKSLLNEKVTDSYGQTHIITPFSSKSPFLGGGQGVVFKSNVPGFVIKFVTDENGNLISKFDDENNYNQYKNTFRNIYLKPFPAKIHLAYPCAVIQEYAGYVMKIMDDMIPFADINPIAGFEDFSQNGNHRRRYMLLSKTAAILSEIHANGMVYCDISPNNVFITSRTTSKAQNVWFIDSDNIYTPTTDQNGKLVYTKRYVAPELESMKAFCSHNSDIYSYAVMAFELISGIHPFAGDKLNNDELSINDWDASIKKSEKGSVDFEKTNLPWVEDLEDVSNHTKNGLPRQYILNEALFKLFNQTFQRGRNNPTVRPVGMFWERAFASASLTAIECSDKNCKMSYFFDSSTERCPWCYSKRPDVLIINKDEKLIFAHEIIQEDGYSFSVPERVFTSTKLGSFDSFLNVVFEIKEHKKCVHLIRDVLAKNNISVKLKFKEQQKELYDILIFFEELRDNDFQIIVSNGGTEKNLTLRLKEA